MNGGYLLDTFKFDENLFFNDHIGSVSTIKDGPLIFNRHGYLKFNGYALKEHLPRQTSLIR